MADERTTSGPAPGEPRTAQDEATARRKAARMKRVKTGVNVGLASFLSVVLFLLANYLSYRHYSRIDWTRGELYTLSQRTKNVLHRISRRINVYVFVSRGDPMYGDLHEIFSRYGAETDRLSVEYVDPDLDPTRFQLLSQRLGVRSGQTSQGQTITDVAVAVSTTERHWFITRDDLQDVDVDQDESGGAQPRVTSVKAEQALTGAVLHVLSSRATKVCFTKGHGEWLPSAYGERGLGHLKDALRPDNFETREVETRGLHAIPSDCDAVLVVGPQRAFSDEEAATLRAYLQGGGNLLCALDPVIGGSHLSPVGLEPMLRELGVRVDDALVLETDPAHKLNPQIAELFIATDWGQHALARSFVQTALAFVSARPIRPAEGSEGVTTLVSTTAQAWGETDIAGLVDGQEPQKGPDDVAGPVSLAVARELEPPPAARAHGGARPRGGRLVVIGDADLFSSDLFREQQIVNSDFVMSAIAWLTQRQELIAIAAKPAHDGSLQLTEGDLSKLFIYVVLLMPGAVILLGAATWWSRRS